jgi:hypothetical protein
MNLGLSLLSSLACFSRRAQAAAAQQKRKPTPQAGHPQPPPPSELCCSAAAIKLSAASAFKAHSRRVVSESRRCDMPFASDEHALDGVVSRRHLQRLPLGYSPSPTQEKSTQVSPVSWYFQRDCTPTSFCFRLTSATRMTPATRYTMGPPHGTTEGRTT